MDTRTALLDAAQHSFATHGYGGTSIRQLATAVGIKESSVYNHFGGKEHLLTAVLDRAEERIAAVARTLGVSIDDPDAALGTYEAIDAGQLERVATAFAEAWLRDPDVVAARRVLTLEQYRTPDAGRRLREWTVDRPLAFQRELFRRLMDAGAFAPADPDAVALAFWGPILTLLAAADSGGDEADAFARLRGHLDHFTATHVADRRGVGPVVGEDER